MGMGGMLEEVDMMILMKMSRDVWIHVVLSFVRLVSLTQQYNKLHFILYDKRYLLCFLQSLYDVIVDVK